MTSVHRLKYDAYKVGDRLLDGVSFGINLEIDGFDVKIVSVEPWGDIDANYLDNINFEKFKALAIKDLQHNIDYLVNLLKNENKTIEKEMDEWEQESGDPGIQIFVEV